jgi:hypothetical protein
VLLSIVTPINSWTPGIKSKRGEEPSTDEGQVTDAHTPSGNMYVV